MSRRYSSESVSSGTIKYASSQKYCASESAVMSRRSPKKTSIGSASSIMYFSRPLKIERRE